MGQSTKHTVLKCGWKTKINHLNLVKKYWKTSQKQLDLYLPHYTCINITVLLNTVPLYTGSIMLTFSQTSIKVHQLPLTLMNFSTFLLTYSWCVTTHLQCTKVSYLPSWLETDNSQSWRNHHSLLLWNVYSRKTKMNASMK